MSVCISVPLAVLTQEASMDRVPYFVCDFYKLTMVCNRGVLLLIIIIIRAYRLARLVWDRQALRGQAYRLQVGTRDFGQTCRHMEARHLVMAPIRDSPQPRVGVEVTPEA